MVQSVQKKLLVYESSGEAKEKKSKRYVYFDAGHPLLKRICFILKDKIWTRDI